MRRDSPLLPLLYSLSSNGDILLLDEPFTYLQNDSDINHLNDIIHTAKDLGKTVIIATHSLEWIDHHADELALLDKFGEIWAIGSLDYFRN